MIKDNVNSKRLMSFILILMLSLSAFSQNDSTYILFDLNSTETYHREDGTGRIIKESIYRLSVPDNDKIVFFIKDLMFVHNKAKMIREDSCDHINMITKKKLLNPDETEKYITQLQKTLPFGVKSQEVSNIFIVMRNKDNDIKLYQVKWQYYIE